MSSAGLLERLYLLAREAAGRGGTVVEIGAWRGASTVALALGLRDAGRGCVCSIDPHAEFTGVLGGRFSEADHAAFLKNIEQHDVAGWVDHRCMTSAAAAKDWQGRIDLLWIDGDHRYDGIANDIRLWVPHLADDGWLVLDDHTPGSDVEVAVRDHLPFAHFQPVERIGKTLILRKTMARTLFLCAGMQSSGSTLVSMCFLQRGDMDGVYDLDNPVIQQDFSRVFTADVWVKMTIGSFRLAEVVALYEAQGWNVRALLVQRETADILASLTGKWYGNDGSTGDDPPLFIRLLRYRDDLRDAAAAGWPVLRYEDFVVAPEQELQRVCTALELPWDPAMMTWPRGVDSFAYPSLGSESLRKTLESGVGLFDVIARYRDIAEHRSPADPVGVALAGELLRCVEGGEGALPPSRYYGTRRDRLERQIEQLHREMRRRDVAVSYIERLLRHAVLGRVIRLWARFVNPSLWRHDWRDPS